MNWIEFISSGLRSPGSTTEFGFNSYAPAYLIAELKAEFRLEELPTDLEEFYRQTNGVDELMDGSKIGELIWPISRVIETNKDYRSDPGLKDIYMSFDQLLFVADAGNGDLFGYITLNGRFMRGIYSWNHEDDSRTWIAADLQSFIAGWVKGTITL
jgi:hypothetical protein